MDGLILIRYIRYPEILIGEGTTGSTSYEGLLPRETPRDPTTTSDVGIVVSWFLVQ